MKTKPKRPTLSELEKEHNSLLVSGKNSKRLQEIIAYLDWIYWGIKKIESMKNTQDNKCLECGGTYKHKPECSNKKNNYGKAI